MFKNLESDILSNINPIILKKKKKNFNIIYNLRKNWKKIIGEKYYPFTAIRDLKINRENQKILHIEIYNSTIAFLLSSEMENIIENIKIYYGYQAIDNIKFIQKPRNIEIKKEKIGKIDSDIEEYLEQSLSNIQNRELKDILLKLGREIKIG
jgi:hypothetical protein